MRSGLVHFDIAVILSWMLHSVGVETNTDQKGNHEDEGNEAHWSITT